MIQSDDAPRHIQAILISCRNILLNRGATDVVGPLHEAMGQLPGVRIEGTRDILTEWIPAALRLVDEKNGDGAATMLHFVHNLPLDEPALRRWDGKHFLTIELPTFLENFELAGSPTELLFFALKRISAFPCPDRRRQP